MIGEAVNPPEGNSKRFKDQNPMKRFGKPEEVRDPDPEVFKQTENKLTVFDLDRGRRYLPVLPHEHFYHRSRFTC